jgi:hypothetical protein
VLAPVIAAFAARYPEVRVDIDQSDRIVDIVDEGFDLAIRIGAIRSQLLVARRIGTTAIVCCASPAYLARHGTPPRPRGSCEARVPDLRVRADAQPVALPRARRQRACRAHRRTDAREQRAHARRARRGRRGIVNETDFNAAPEIASGRLVPILTEWPQPTIPIQAAYPSRPPPVGEGACVRRLSRRCARRPAMTASDGLAGGQQRLVLGMAAHPRAHVRAVRRDAQAVLLGVVERGAHELARDAASLERDRDLGMMNLQHVADAPVVAAREPAVHVGLEAMRGGVVNDFDGRVGMILILA